MSKPPVRVYCGIRTQEGCSVTFHEGNRATSLPVRLDLWNHSPTGFEWGYVGSGPAQLALALIAHATGDDALAVELHQEFKRQVLGPICEDCWALPAKEVQRIIEQIRQAREYATDHANRAFGRPAPE